jgi:hypothetical protein
MRICFAKGAKIEFFGFANAHWFQQAWNSMDLASLAEDSRLFVNNRFFISFRRSDNQISAKPVVSDEDSFVWKMKSPFPLIAHYVLWNSGRTWNFLVVS